MKYKIFLLISLILMTFIVSAQNYNNPKIPRITNPTISSVSVSLNVSSNVSSVTSSNNCILVNPTTGNVVLTFNSSCATTAQNFLTNQLNNNLNTTSNVTFNNITVNQEIIINNNRISPWLYNQTLAVFLMSLLNNTIGDYGVRVGFNSTFNSTYAPWSYNQTYNNMTLGTNRSNCWFDDCSGYRNPFNQVLNTTSNVTFFADNIDSTTLGAWTTFKFFGSQVGRITSENLVFQIMGLPGTFATWLGDCGSACLIAGVDGIFQMSATKSNQVRNNNVVDLEINNTMTTVYTNLTVNYNLTLLGETYSKQNITVIGNVTAKVDLCNGDGKCLNQTIKDPNTFRNGTMLYWNNNTRGWFAVADTPANSEVPVWCSTGTGGGWIFIDKAAGACPL